MSGISRVPPGVASDLKSAAGRAGDGPGRGAVEHLQAVQAGGEQVVITVTVDVTRWASLPVVLERPVRLGRQPGALQHRHDGGAGQAAATVAAPAHEGTVGLLGLGQRPQLAQTADRRVCASRGIIEQLQRLGRIGISDFPREHMRQAQFPLRRALGLGGDARHHDRQRCEIKLTQRRRERLGEDLLLRSLVVHHAPDSYTHLRAHETVLDIVCRLPLEKKKKPHHFTYKLPHTSVR